MMRVLLVALSYLCATGVVRAEPTLASLGTVCWNQDALPADAFEVQREQSGERCLHFGEGSAITSYNYLAGAKEGFSGGGRYTVAGGELTITHEADWEAWPARKAMLPLTATCRFEVTERSSLVLSDCPLSGEWSR